MLPVRTGSRRGAVLGGSDVPVLVIAGSDFRKNRELIMHKRVCAPRTAGGWWLYARCDLYTYCVYVYAYYISTYLMPFDVIYCMEVISK